MSKTTIIKNLQKHIGDKLVIRYSLGRNKFETYFVTLKKLYSHVFIVEDDNLIRCFSYSDIIMKSIKVYLLKDNY